VPLLSTGQEINEQRFRADVNSIYGDGRVAFTETIGAYKNTNYNHRYYDTEKSIFGLGTASVVYHPFEYFVTIRETEPEDFWFTQDFNTDTPEGTFVLNNAERIFDELAATMKLKKKQEKIKGRDKKVNLRLIEYRNQSKNLVFQLKFSAEEKIAQIFIHSDSKPADAPNYLGCLILYNLDSSNYAKNATALFVYGEKVVDVAQLYRNALSKGSGSYNSYEWIEGASRQDIHDKLKALVTTYNSERIDPEGYAID